MKTLLPILYWVLLILCCVGLFLPATTLVAAKVVFVLFIIIGLKIFGD